MKYLWRPHWLKGLSIAKVNGCSIIRDTNSQVHRNHHSIMGGAAYEVLKNGDIHRFNSTKEMKAFVEEQK
jgi:hypothetical protein